MALEPPEISVDETADATRQRRLRTEEASGVRRAARLKAAYPPGADISIDLAFEPAVLGRAPEDPTSVAIHDKKISREHFRVEWDRGLKTHVGRDLESRNGSWVDGRASRTGWRPLRDGSVVRIGGLILIYELGHLLEQEDGRSVSTEAVPGSSIAVCALRARIAVAAKDLSPALIMGETGTGKEQIARELHRLSGRTGEFVAINCATFSDQLIESQLFGHKKGAFTGAETDQPGLFRAAEGGTLFLDEIGEMPLDLQPKLLRAIQEREVTALGSTTPQKVDVRVVAATHRDLQARARDGRFRQDLYARLALWEVPVPSVRARKSDVLEWLTLMHRLWLEERGKEEAPLAVEADVAERLLLFDWPENLRGISRLVHELATRKQDGPITQKELPTWLK